jgi:hypothetical protein
MDLAGLAGVAATPATAWDPGQYVPTRTGDAHWDGAAWQAGRGSAPVGAAGHQPQSSPRLVAQPGGYATALKPGQRPRNLQELAARVDPAGREPWPEGSGVPIGTSGKRAHWTGTEWRGGVSPGYAPQRQQEEPDGDAEPPGGNPDGDAAPPGEEPVQLTATDDEPAGRHSAPVPPAPYRTQFPGDEQPGDLTR